MTTENKRMQQLRDTSVNWAANNPVLLDGEIAWSTNTAVMKIGDGVLTYNALPEFTPVATVALIGDIGNVVITAPTTTQFLRFNGVNWINSDTDLDALSDVDTTGAISGDSLVFDGFNWKPVLVTTGGAGAVELDDLIDVDTTTVAPISGNHLIFNGAVWTPEQGNQFTTIDYTPIAQPAFLEGRTFYDSSEDGFFYFNNDSTVAFEYSDLIIEVRNNTGSVINRGAAVYVTGTLGQRPTIALAQADSVTTARVAGIVASTSIPNNSNGYIMRSGVLRNANTSAFVDGDLLYLSPSVAGGFTTTKPVASDEIPIILGSILFSNPSQGKAYVQIRREINVLDDLLDVVVSSPSEKQSLAYNATTGIWENRGPILWGLDDRDIKPNVAHIDQEIDVRTYFTSLEGLTGTAGVNFQDLLVMDTWKDASGGDLNALAFDKSEKLLRLYQAAPSATTWGTPFTLAFLEKAQSWSAFQTFDGNIDVGQINNSAVIAFLNGGLAQGINTGQVLISNSYADVSLVPTNGMYSKGVIRSGVAGGTAPFVVASTTTVINLSADRLDDKEAADFILFDQLSDPSLFPKDWVTAGMIAPALISTQHIDARGWTQETDWTSSLRVIDSDGNSTYVFGTSTNGQSNRDLTEMNLTDVPDSAIQVSTQVGRRGAFLVATNTTVNRQHNPPFTWVCTAQDIFMCEISMVRASGTGQFFFGGTSATSEDDLTPITHEVLEWNFTTKQWDAKADFGNTYFWSGFTVGAWIDVKSYIVGHEVLASDIPPPSLIIGDVAQDAGTIQAIRLKADKRFAYTRFLNWDTPTANGYFANHRVTDMAMGRILATHIHTENLSAVSANLGTIKAGNISIEDPDDARNRVVLDPASEAPFVITGSDGTAGATPKTVLNVSYGNDTTEASLTIEGFVNGTAGSEFIKSGGAFTDQAIKDINPWFAGGGTEGNTGSSSVTTNIQVSATTGAGVTDINITFDIFNGGSYRDFASSRGWTSQSVRVQIRKGSVGGSILFDQTFNGSASNVKDTESGSPSFGLWDGDYSTVANGSVSDGNATESATTTYFMVITVTGGTASGQDSTYAVNEFKALPIGWLMPVISSVQNGYWKDPSTGMIIQWGQRSVGANATSGLFNLPVAFPVLNAISIADSMENSASSQPAMVITKTKSQINIINGAGSTQTCQFIAIGF